MPMPFWGMFDDLMQVPSFMLNFLAFLWLAWLCLGLLSFAQLCLELLSFAELCLALLGFAQLSLDEL